MDNLGESVDNGLIVGRTSSGSDIMPFQEFSTGPTSYTNETITVVLTLGDLSSGSPSNFTVEIFDQSAGTPNNSIATLSGESDPFTAGDYTYTGTVSLAANTSYYIACSATASSNGSYYAWMRTISSSISTSDGFSSPYERYYTNGGVGTTIFNQRALFSLSIVSTSGSDVPTLSEWGLIILAFLLMTLGTLVLVQPNWRAREF